MDFSDIVESIAIQSAKAIGIADGDYEQDGLLYCGKCHTPKQTFIEQTATPVFCLCQCQQKAVEKEEAEQKRRDAVARASRLRVEGFADSAMRSCTFSNDDSSNAKLSDVARRYVANFPRMLKEGQGLLLFGTVGTGKTFMAACIANALIDEGHPCLVTNFPRLANGLLDAGDGKQSFLDSLNRYDLLVIDDLGSERDTEFMAETVQSVIDSRYRVHKPLIVTTNLTADELKRPADMKEQRLYSRLMELCIPVEVAGKDRRKEKLKENYASTKELLGL